MTSVDEFVRESILIYPTIFKNRTDVLHFIFCSSKNDEFLWTENGDVPLPTGDHWTAEKEIAHSEKLMGKWLAYIGAGRVGYDENMHLRIAECEKTMREVEARMHETGAIIQRLPQTELRDKVCLITNIPSNVQDDWREACDEIKLLLVNDGWDF